MTETQTPDYEERNGYCGCGEMQRIYSLRRKAESLEGKVQHFRMETDLKAPRADDLEYLQDYKGTLEQFDSAVLRYYGCLTEMMKAGMMKLILHNGSGEREISYAELPSFKGKPEKIITLHCKKCSQQVDVAAD